MNYCVLVNTTIVVDGSDNPLEIMLQNAQNAGFSESEIEILTEEGYLARVELEPKPMAEPTAEKRFSAIEEVIMMLI